MSNLSDLFPSGGGGTVPTMIMPFKTSGTWTVPFDMDVVIHAVGGGGSGAGGRVTGGRFGGGGAGGHAIKKASLLAGTVVTVAVGALTTTPASTGTTYQVAGLDGKDTTVSTPDFSVVAYGGKGGAAVGQAEALIGAPGGLGQGYDALLQGGRGGQALALGGSGYMVTGGGAVNLFNIPCNGGDLGGAASASLTMVTSGGGVAEPGVGGSSFGGALCSGPGRWAITSNNSAAAEVYLGETLWISPVIGPPTVSKVDATPASPSAPGFGCGGGSFATSSGAAPTQAHTMGGIFAGGGGVLQHTGGSVTSLTGGYGQYGGGGGAAYSGPSAATSVQGGVGAPGFVLIEVYAK